MSEKGSGVGLKRGHEKGTLGKGTSLSSPGRGHVRAWRAPLGCPGWLCAGRPPCNQGSGLCFCSRWPFAILLLWLPGESGNPVRRVRATVSAPEGEMELSGPPAHPVSRGGPFPRPRRLSACWRPGQRDPLESGRVTAFAPWPPVKPLGMLRPLWPPCSPGGRSEALLSCSGVGMAPQTLAAQSSLSLLGSSVFPCPCLCLCVRPCLHK